VTPQAPAGWFDVLLDRERPEGLGLPDAFRAVVGADWRIPEREEPYLYVNFCTGRDGRVSFSEPGHMGGGDVSGFDDRDRWLMGLLRARADAVMVGDGTMKAEPEHLWTPAGIYPAEAEAFAALRAAEGRAAQPLQVFVSKDGALPWDAAPFEQPDLHVVVAVAGDPPREIPRTAAHVDALAFSGSPAELVRLLAARYSLRTIVCEGGPRLYGSMLADGLPLDEFVTLSPLVLGDGGDRGSPRPSLVEGIRFAPGTAPRSRLVTVRAAADGDHLYLRSRYESRTAPA